MTKATLKQPRSEDITLPPLILLFELHTFVKSIRVQPNMAATDPATYVYVQLPSPESDIRLIQ
jgi:hypothetical protein